MQVVERLQLELGFVREQQLEERVVGLRVGVLILDGGAYVAVDLAEHDVHLEVAGLCPPAHGDVLELAHRVRRRVGEVVVLLVVLGELEHQPRPRGARLLVAVASRPSAGPGLDRRVDLDRHLHRLQLRGVIQPFERHRRFQRPGLGQLDDLEPWTLTLSPVGARRATPRIVARMDVTMVSP